MHGFVYKKYLTSKALFTKNHFLNYFLLNKTFPTKTIFQYPRIEKRFSLLIFYIYTNIKKPPRH